MNSKTQNKIKKAKFLLETYLGMPVGDVAKAVGFSNQEGLYILMTRHGELGPKNYRNQKILEAGFINYKNQAGGIDKIKAALLSQPFATIQAISEKFKFESLGSFSVWFKQQESISPLQYRKQEMNKHGRAGYGSRKVEAVKDLLEENEKPLEEISKVAGYKHLRSCKVAFKQATRLTITDYKIKSGVETSWWQAKNFINANSQGKFIQAKYFLESYVATPVHEAAEILGFRSGADLAKLFKAHAGVSIKEFREQKLKEAGFAYHTPESVVKAMVMIERKTANDNLVSIARTCGLTPQNLYNNFHRTLKISPSAYACKYKRDEAGLKSEAWAVAPAPD